MKNSRIIIITSSINVENGIPFLKLRDPKERLQQYINAILFLFGQNSKLKFVVGENTGMKCPQIIEEYVKKNGIDFEWLCFQGNKDKIYRFGKGYGEVEIINYIINHSELIKGSNSFVKLTGRLIVRNINRVIKSMNEESNWFLTYGDNILEKLDTRLYSMQISVWNKCISNVYNEEYRYESSIEKLFVERLRKYGEKISSIRIQPNFIGQSGGYGAYYYTSIKDEILKTVNRYIATINRNLYLEPVIMWQGDMLIPNQVWENTFKDITRKKIFICGANLQGYRFFYIARKKCRIIGWSDKKYVGRIIEGKKIEDIKALRRKKADYIAIAAMNNDTILELRKQIIEMSYSEKQIISIKNRMYERGYEHFLL